jgi:DNA-binding beta-propeller fold protein YncE
MRRALSLIAFCLLVLPASAQAAAPDFLLRVPDEAGKPGSGAGQLDNPRSVAANPDTGHLYITELNNSRISEFTAWGLFVKAWGWGVDNGNMELQTCGPSEPEVEPELGHCQQGIQGDSRGQLNRPTGITLDGASDVYVLDRDNRRVQKFSPEGEFLLMFGGGVNETSGGDICPRVGFPGDACKAGVGGEGPGQFEGASGNYISYSPADDAIVVGGKSRVQVFETDGTLREEITFTGGLEALEGRTISALAANPVSGDLYVAPASSPPTEEQVFRIDPTAKEIVGTLPVPYPEALATDVNGNAYAVLKRYSDSSAGTLDTDNEVLGFDSAGEPIAGMEIGDGFAMPEFIGVAETPPLLGVGTNYCPGGGPEDAWIYTTAFKFGIAAYAEAFGPGPTCYEAPPLRPPAIAAQYATAVGADSASVQAQISPQFWDDTTYYVEYGKGVCSEGGCPDKAPLSPAQLTETVTNKVLKTSAVVLGGLDPASTYHYRFVAESSGGGPEYGLRPSGEEKVDGAASFEAGLEGTFSTFKLDGGEQSCPANEAFRGGPSAKLPDCRAYELVSPLDKDNGDAALLPNESHALNRSATSGERFTYSSLTPFADPQSAPYISQFLSSRGRDGWSSQDLSPQLSASALPVKGALNNEFKGFSDDLCSAWLRNNSVAPLTEEGVVGFANLYRRENCVAQPSYETLSPVEPPNRPAAEYQINAMGASADGKSTLVLAADALVAGAPVLEEIERKEPLLYLHGPGGFHFVCYLPNGNPITTACGAGISAAKANADGAISSVDGAISADGARVFWTAFSGKFELNPTGIPGRIYMRQNPEEPQSTVTGGECTEPEKACTIAVSGSVSPEAAEFWGAAEDGSKAIFRIVEGPQSGDVYEFDVATKTSQLIAERGLAPMGMSEDASRLYFASREVLAEGAEDGASNLYLYEAPEGGGEGSFEFIMGLTDLGGSLARPGAVDLLSRQRSSSVTPDGLHAAFTSRASPTPTGYDNLDAQSGEPAQVAYRYDAAADELVCVSCNPTGARPRGVDVGGVRDAAQLASRSTPLHAPRSLSSDGRRLFFESFEQLVPRDTNGAWDVYQWEEAGKGSCDGGDPTFNPETGGCVDLISTGLTPSGARFLDADPSGSNVFIGTQGSLISADPGSNDVYVARVNGGFPEPAPPEPACEGEACQSSPPAPEPPAPASAAFRGPGNPLQGPERCGALGRRAKAVSNRAKRLRRGARRANATRRVGRNASNRTRPARLSRKARRLSRRAHKLAKRNKRCRRAARGRAAR